MASTVSLPSHRPDDEHLATRTNFIIQSDAFCKLISLKLISSWQPLESALRFEMVSICRSETTIRLAISPGWWSCCHHSSTWARWQLDGAGGCRRWHSSVLSIPTLSNRTAYLLENSENIWPEIRTNHCSSTSYDRKNLWQKEELHSSNVINSLFA